MLAFRMGQEVFGSEVSCQRTVERSLIFSFDDFGDLEL